MEKKLEEELTDLDTQLKKRREKRYYSCKTCSLEVNEENALLNDFICPECEQIYELADNTEMVQKLEKDIARIKKEMEFVAIEKAKEGEKLEKKKAKKIKKSEEDSKKKRKQNREIKLEELKKSQKKQAKSKSKEKKFNKKIKKKISKKLNKLKHKKK